MAFFRKCGKIIITEQRRE